MSAIWQTIVLESRLDVHNGKLAAPMACMGKWAMPSACIKITELAKAIAINTGTWVTWSINATLSVSVSVGISNVQLPLPSLIMQKLGIPVRKLANRFKNDNLYVVWTALISLVRIQEVSKAAEVVSILTLVMMLGATESILLFLMPPKWLMREQAMLLDLG